MAAPREALAIARAVAAAARQDPSAINVTAARRAIDDAMRSAARVRHDAHGYNPYRDKGGKFAPGAHKARPKVDRVASAAAAVEKHGARAAALGKRLAVHKASYAAAIGDAKHALETARAKAEIARAKPTQRNTKAAQAAVNRATRSAAKVGKIEAKVGKATAAHAAAVAKHEDRIREHKARKLEAEWRAQNPNWQPPQKGKTEPVATKPGDRVQEAESSRPRHDRDLIDAIGNGGIRDAHGELVGLNPEAQAAVRAHFDKVLADHGVSSRRVGSEAHLLESMSTAEMGGADGSYNNRTGKITLSETTTADLGFHAANHARDPQGAMHAFHELTTRGEAEAGMAAYNAIAHETLHGHGPRVAFDPAKPHEHQLAEEMSTEMAARSITASVHGFSPDKFLGGGYEDVMHLAVQHVANAAGVPHAKAFETLARSAVSFKRLSGAASPDAALRHMAQNTMHVLGKGPKHVDDLMARWNSLASEMGKRYPWP